MKYSYVCTKLRKPVYSQVFAGVSHCKLVGVSKVGKINYRTVLPHFNFSRAPCDVVEIAE